VHPSGKFLYVMNFGTLSNEGGGDIDEFAIDGAKGELTLTGNAISGNGSQPMGIAFNRLGTRAYVVFGRSTLANPLSSRVALYDVDLATGAFTGPLSTYVAAAPGNYPWSIAIDPNGKALYVANLGSNEVVTFGINATSGALRRVTTSGIGGFAGGFVARRYSLAASLWIGGVLQAVANLSFSWLALVGVNQWALAFAITAENFTSAIGTVIFVAYLSALCRNPLHTATQYALLTALAAVGRTYLSSGAGYVAKATGWPLFFVICVVVAVPSLILLAWLQRRGHFEALGPVKV
jgi:hypothetical protein